MFIVWGTKTMIAALGKNSVLFSLALLLSACGEYESEVKDFKSSTAYADLSYCLGLESSILVNGFKSTEIPSEDTIVIQTNFTKDSNNFVGQWIYNKNLKISELIFLGKEGSDETVMTSNNFADLCGKSSTQSNLSQNLQFKNDKRPNKKYGMALASFGDSVAAQNRTISLAGEINKLKIEEARQVQMIDNSYAVISANLNEELSPFQNLSAQTLESKFSEKGMRLDIQNIFIVKPYKEVRK